MHSIKHIKRISSSELQIVWGDRTDSIPTIKLRKFCPCAGCAEQRGELNHSRPLSGPAPETPVKKNPFVIIEHGIDEQTKLEEIWGVGNYAIGCKFADGHSSGIYTFAKLREIADNKSA